MGKIKHNNKKRLDWLLLHFGAGFSNKKQQKKTITTTTTTDTNTTTNHRVMIYTQKIPTSSQNHFIGESQRWLCGIELAILTG